MTGYRLVNSLRYGPATAKAAIKVGAAKVVGKGKARALTLAVRNTGNTLDPVSGSVKLKSALGTKNVSVKPRGSCPARASEPRADVRELAEGREVHGDDLADAGQAEDDVAKKTITVRR